MNSGQIAKLIGKSPSTVSKILHGNLHFSEHTIRQVHYYQGIELNIVKEVFAEPIFKDICGTVIKKTMARDADNATEIIRFAAQCLRWHNLLLEDRGMTEAEKLSIASLNENMFAILVDKLFYDMLEICLLKSRSSRVRERAAMLQDLTNNFRRAKR